MDSIAKTIFTPRRLLGLMAASWAVAFVILGYRRWGCDLPWTSSCMVEFGRRLETGVLFLWVDDWETVFGALLAVAAAGVSVYFLNRQIRQKETMEERRIERRLAAVQAAMPLTLSSVCQFTIEGASQWMTSVHRQDVVHAFGRSELETALVFPELPLGVRDDLMLMIEALDSKGARPYRALLERLQVALTRARGYFDDHVERQNMTALADYCYGQAAELVEIYARAAALFPTVRDETNVKATEPSLEAVLRSRLLMSIHGIRAQTVAEKIRMYYRA